MTGTPSDLRERNERIISLAKQGIRAPQVASMVGVTRETVRCVIKSARAAGVYCPPFPVGRIGEVAHVRLSAGLRTQLITEAGRRRTTISALVTDIIAAVLEDDIVAAVLDD